ncbi:hypothetical protein APED_01820 [Acanthopleuribacter pedis]
MVPVCFLLLSTLAAAPAKDPNFQAIKLYAKPEGIQPGMFKMAQGFHVLYGTRDLANIEPLYEATRLIHRGATDMELWLPLPKLPKKYKKDPNLIRQSPFLRGTVLGNQALAEALQIGDAAQRYANLRRLYPQQPNHLPTLIAIAEVLWEIGETEAGNDFAAAVAAVIPPETYVPAALVVAELTRKTVSYEEGRAILEAAARLPFRDTGPAKQRLAEWDKTMATAAGDPAALYAVRAEKALVTLAKTNPEALFYLGKLKTDQRKPLDSYRYLTKAVKKKPDNHAALLFLYEKKGKLLDDPAETRALAKRAMKKTGEHPVLLTLIAIRNPTMKEAKRKAMLAKALDMDPTYLPAWRAWFAEHPTAEPAWRRAELKKMTAANPTSSEVLAMVLAMRHEHGDYEGGDALVAKALGMDPLTPALLSKCLDLYPQLASQDLKNRLILSTVHQASLFAARFEFYKAGDFVAKAAEMEPGIPRLGLLAANYLYRGGYHADAAPHYEAAMATVGKSPALYELIGDGFFARGKMHKAIQFYRKTLALDGTRPSPPEKIEDAKTYMAAKTSNPNVRIPAPGSLFGFIHLGQYGKTYKPPSVAKARALQSWRQVREGYGLTETEPMLLPLYNRLLDWEEDYGFEPMELTQF